MFDILGAIVLVISIASEIFSIFTIEYKLNNMRIFGYFVLLYVFHQILSVPGPSTVGLLFTLCPLLSINHAIRACIVDVQL